VGDTGSWAWGLATMIAIYIAGGISGENVTTFSQLNNDSEK
jgi:glycerol uptake facilitator-like aquaporin